MFARPIVAISLIVLGLIVLLGLAAAVVAVTIDLRLFLEQRLSKSLDRRVSIGALKIDWGNPLKLEIRDVRLANAAWGSTPDMVQLERLSAEIDSKALFSGVLRYHKLIVIKP